MLVLAVAATSPVVLAQPQPAEAPKALAYQLPPVQRGQKVEILTSGSHWDAGTVMNSNGGLVLVGEEGWDEKQFFWKWIARDQVRLPGETHEGPDWTKEGLVTETVGNSTIEEARLAAQRALDARTRATAADVADLGGGGGGAGAAVPKGGFGQQPADAGEGEAGTFVDRTPFGGAQWSYEPAEASAIGQLRPRAGRMTPADDGSVEDVDVAGGAVPMAMVGRVIGRMTEATAVGAELFDLRAGDGRVVQLPVDLRPLALAPGGSKLAAKSYAFGFGKSNRLEIFDVNVKAGTATESVKCFPFGREGHQTDIESAGFVGGSGEQVLAVSRGEQVKVITLDGLGGWEASIQGTAVGVRPDGMAIALAVGNWVYLLDPAGNTIGRLEGELSAAPIAVAFDAAGTRLATRDRNATLTVWDLADGGKRLVTTGLAPDSGDGLAFVGDGLLMAGLNLVDPTTGGIVWHYEHDGRIAAQTGAGEAMVWVQPPEYG